MAAHTACNRKVPPTLAYIFSTCQLGRDKVRSRIISASFACNMQMLELPSFDIFLGKLCLLNISGGRVRSGG